MIGFNCAPQRYVVFASSALLNVPEVADQRILGLTPKDALVVEVRATSLPAAFSNGDTVYEVIIGHSRLVTFASTLTLPTRRGAGAPLNSSPPEQPIASSRQILPAPIHKTDFGRNDAAHRRRIAGCLARSTRKREVRKCITDIVTDSPIIGNTGP